MKFGVWIPSYCYPGLDYDRVRREVADACLSWLDKQGL